MRTVVYEYGLREPTDNTEAISTQYWLAHRYYNALCAAERTYRREILAAQRAIPAIAAAQDALDAANERRETLAQQGEKDLGEVNKACEEALEALKETKAKEKETLAPAYAELSRQRADEHKRIYGEFGELYWGTKLVTMQAFDAACKPPPVPPRKPTPWEDRPAFRRWRPGQPPVGQIAVQIIRGMPAEDVFGNDTRVQVDPLDPTAFDESYSRGHRRRAQYTTLRMRISSVGRAPVWAEWPLYLHRPFPAGSRIKWVRVIRTPHKQRQEFKWVVQFTLDVPEVISKRIGGIVAVNLGWRRMGDAAMRVATWVDSDGNTGELRLGDLFVARMSKANSLRSVRDQHLDKLKADFLGERCAQWKSHERFHQLLKNAEEEKLSAQETEALREWAYRDRHLWWYERGLRNGALNYRREQYRLLTKQLAQNYRYVVVENYDLRPIAEDPNRAQLPSRQRVEGSPSQARFALRSAAEREGAIVIDGDSKLATQVCSWCGCDEPWNAAPQVEHTCPGCGRTWDQDVNNARNMLAWAQEGLKRGDLPVKRVKRPPRFAKRHKKSKKKKK